MLPDDRILADIRDLREKLKFSAASEISYLHTLEESLGLALRVRDWDLVASIRNSVTSMADRLARVYERA